MSTFARRAVHDARRTARAEAAAWVVRLHGPYRSPKLEAALRRWLDADPEHARQFEQVTDTWEAGARVPAGGLPRVRGRAAAMRPGRRALAAAAVLGVAALVFLARGIVRPGTAYRTGTGETRAVRLGDGTRVFLDTDSEVRVAYTNTVRRVWLERGEAYFAVTHNPSWPFIVEAGRHQITDIGTTFMVRYGADSTAVMLIEGRVAVSSRSRWEAGRDAASLPLFPPQGGQTQRAANPPPQAILLHAGQRITFTEGQSPRLDAPPMERLAAWLHHEIMLDDTPLSEAILELNRYDSAALAIDDPRVAGLRVSGIYHTGNNRQFALLISKLYGIRVSERRGRILLGAASQAPR